MTDAELITYLRSVSHALDVALTSVASKDPPKAIAAIRAAQDAVEHAVYQLRQRDDQEVTKV
jgi:hypothetical protein